MPNSKIPNLNLNDTFNLLRTRFNQLIDSVGDLGTLNTDNTGTIVAAINSVDSNVGDRSALTTTANTSVVAGVNETSDRLDSINSTQLITPFVTSTDSSATNVVAGNVNALSNVVVNKTTTTSYLNVADSARVSGAFSTGGGVIVGGDMSVAGDMTIHGETTFDSVAISGSLTVAYPSQFTRELTVSQALTVQDSAYITGDLYVGGDVYLDRSLSLESDLTVAGDFTILGDFILSGTQKTAGQYIQLLDGVGGTPTLNAGITVDRGTGDSAELLWNETADQWELGTVGARSRIVYDGGPADLASLVVDANTITLNNDQTGTPSDNVGILVERGTATNAQLLWNETSDRWTTAGAATGTFAYTSEINNSTISLVAGTDLNTGGSFTTNASSGSTITFNHSSVARSNTTSTASPDHGGTFTAIDSIGTSLTGHVTSVRTKTITLPGGDDYVSWTAKDSSDDTYDITSADTLQIKGKAGVIVSNFIADDILEISHGTVTRTNNTSTATPAAGGTFTAIDTITTNVWGHVTAVNTKTVTMPTVTTTTYSISSETVSGGANLRLTGSGGSTDDVKIAAGANVTVTRTDADTITIASTDTNTTYSAGTGLTLTGTSFSHTAHTGDVTGSTALTIAADAVTYAKMQNVTTANRVLGSTTAGGVISEVQVNSNMLADNAVTQAKLADDAVGSAELKTVVTFSVKNSAGTTLKTLYGAGA